MQPAASDSGSSKQNRAPETGTRLSRRGLSSQKPQESRQSSPKRRQWTPSPSPPQRLTMRPWRPEDREPFFAINCEPEVLRHLTPLTREESDGLIDRSSEQFAEYRMGTLGAGGARRAELSSASAA